jgi:hypothetical protein
MHIFMKYSSPFVFEVNTTIPGFREHFRVMKDGNIRKKSDEEKMFYSQ